MDAVLRVAIRGFRSLLRLAPHVPDTASGLVLEEASYIARAVGEGRLVEPALISVFFGTAEGAVERSLTGFLFRGPQRFPVLVPAAVAPGTTRLRIATALLTEGDVAVLGLGSDGFVGSAAVFVRASGSDEIFFLSQAARLPGPVQTLTGREFSDEAIEKLYRVLNRDIGTLSTVLEPSYRIRIPRLLQGARIHRIGDLIQKSDQELLKLPQFGDKTVAELQRVLQGPLSEQAGTPISLGMLPRQLYGWPV